jgi:hypothetical protein
VGKSVFLVLSGFLAFSPVLLAQTVVERDIHSDQRQLEQFQWRLRQDQSRLSFDRRNHAPKLQIREDRARVQNDKAAIRLLRADMRRDLNARRRRDRGL